MSHYLYSPPGRTAPVPVVHTAAVPSWSARLRRFQAPALLVLFGVLCALTVWLRLSPVARDTFWAEDGRDFVADAARLGPGSLFRPYAGYLHTVPRLISLAVVSLPVSTWAQATTAGACAVAGVLAVVVFVCTRDVVPWMPARIFIAALTVLAPLGPREVLGNLANLHSVFLWALFWVLLARPRGRGSTIALAGVALLGALTEIQAVVLIPLMLLRPHDRNRWIVRGALLAGLAAQVVTAIGWPRAHDPNPLVSLPSLAYGYLINAATPLAVPQADIGTVLAATGPAVGLAVLACVLGATGYVVLRGSRVQRAAAIAALTASMLLWAIDVEANASSLYDYASLSRTGLESVWLARYGVVPSILLAAIVVMAVAVAVRRRGRMPQARRILAAAAALLAVSVLIQAGPQATRRSHGPAWRPQIAAAADTCRDNPQLISVELKETLSWSVRVPCTALSSIPAHR